MERCERKARGDDSDGRGCHNRGKWGVWRPAPRHTIPPCAMHPRVFFPASRYHKPRPAVMAAEGRGDLYARALPPGSRIVRGAGANSSVLTAPESRHGCQRTANSPCRLRVTGPCSFARSDPPAGKLTAVLRCRATSSSPPVARRRRLPKTTPASSPPECIARRGRAVRYAHAPARPDREDGRCACSMWLAELRWPADGRYVATDLAPACGTGALPRRRAAVRRAPGPPHRWLRYCGCPAYSRGKSSGCGIRVVTTGPRPQIWTTTSSSFAMS